MKEFIESAAKQLGIDASVMEKATGAVMSFLQSNLGETEFGELAEKLPESKELADDFSATPYAANGAMLYAAYAHAGNDSSTAISQLQFW